MNKNVVIYAMILKFWEVFNPNPLKSRCKINPLRSSFLKKEKGGEMKSIFFLSSLFLRAKITASLASEKAGHHSNFNIYSVI